MKARIRKTGEIVDVICYGGSPLSRSNILDYVTYIDSQGVEHTEPNHLNYYWDFEPIETATDEHWQDVYERAAIAAMQGMLSCGEGAFSYQGITDDIAKAAVDYADSLIKELKKETIKRERL